MSVPGRTMPASLPPSSSVRRFKVSAAPSITDLPVLIEPVNTILLMSGWVTIRLPTSASPVTTLTTPGGRTWFINSTRRSVDRGVYGEGLMTMVQPTRTAGMMCQVAIIRGQFHGVIEPTTPTGLRWITIRPFLSSWIVCSGRERPAVTRVQATQPPASRLAPGPLWVLPCSRVTSAESSPACCSSRSATLMRAAARSASGSAAHPGSARWAAATAWSRRATLPSGQAPTTVPSAGLSTLEVRPVWAGLPSIVSG